MERNRGRLHAIIIDCDSLKNLVSITKIDIYNMISKIKSTSEELGLDYIVECLHISLEDEIVFKDMVSDRFQINWYKLSVLNLEKVMKNRQYQTEDRLCIYITGHSGVMMDSWGDSSKSNEPEINNTKIELLINPDSKLFYNNSNHQQSINSYELFLNQNGLNEEQFVDLFNLSKAINLTESSIQDEGIKQFLIANNYFVDENSSGSGSGSGNGNWETDGGGQSTTNHSQAMNEQYLYHSKQLQTKPAYSFDFQHKNIYFKSDYLDEVNLNTTIPFFSPKWCTNDREIAELWKWFVEIEGKEKRFWFKTKDGRFIDSRKEPDTIATQMDIDFVSWEDFLNILVDQYPYLLFFKTIATYYDAYNHVMLKPFSYDVVEDIDRWIVNKNLDTYICLKENQQDVFPDDLLRRHIIDFIPSNIRTLCVADLCYSGSIFDLDFSLQDGKTVQVREGEGNKDIFSISACSDYELSYKNGYGFFTAAIHGNISTDSTIFKTDIIKKFLTYDLNNEETLQELYDEVLTNNTIIYIQNNSYKNLVIPTPYLQTMARVARVGTISRWIDWIRNNKKKSIPLLSGIISVLILIIFLLI
jgi:hypothetical protein